MTDQQHEDILTRRSTELAKARSDLRDAQAGYERTLRANGELVRETLDLREEVAQLTRELTNAREPIELRAEVERLNETVRLDGVQIRSQSDRIVELTAEIVAHEDRQARVWEMGRQISAGIACWKAAGNQYTKDCGDALWRLQCRFADILTPPNEGEDWQSVHEPSAPAEPPVVTKEMAIAHMEQGGVISHSQGLCERRIMCGHHQSRGMTSEGWSDWRYHSGSHMNDQPNFYTILPIEPAQTVEVEKSDLPAPPPGFWEAFTNGESADENTACDRGDSGPVLGVKLLREGAKTPTRATDGSAGLDVYACIIGQTHEFIGNGGTRVIKLGIALDIPDGYHIDCRARSGNDSRGEFTVRLGLIDSDFRGEVGVIVHVPFNPDRQGMVTIKHGDKIAQLVLRKTEVLPLVEVQELSQTARGTRGFGSSDGVKP